MKKGIKTQNNMFGKFNLDRKGEKIMCFITLTEHKIKKNQNHQHTIYKCKTNMVEKRIGWNRIVHSDTIFLGWPKYYLIKEDGFKEKKKYYNNNKPTK